MPITENNYPKEAKIPGLTLPPCYPWLDLPPCYPGLDPGSVISPRNSLNA